MLNPTNVQLVDFLAKKLGYTIDPFMVSELSLKKALDLYLGHEHQAGGQEDFDESLDESDSQDSTGIKIFNKVISYGLRNNASDIHIEPTASKINIRYRIDGTMMPNLRPSKTSRSAPHCLHQN